MPVCAQTSAFIPLKSAGHSPLIAGVRQRLPVNIDQKQNSFTASNIDNRVRHIGAISCRISLVQDLGMRAGLDADASLFHDDKLPGALEVGRAAQCTARFQPDLIKFHILFQVQRRKGSNLTIRIRTIDLRPVLPANDLYCGSRPRRFHQFPEGQTKGPRDAHRHSEGRIGPLTLDLAEHRATHAADSGEGLQRPASSAPQLSQPLAQFIRCGRRAARF